MCVTVTLSRLRQCSVHGECGWKHEANTWKYISRKEWNLTPVHLFQLLGSSQNLKACAAEVLQKQERRHSGPMLDQPACLLDAHRLSPGPSVRLQKPAMREHLLTLCSLTKISAEARSLSHTLDFSIKRFSCLCFGSEHLLSCNLIWIYYHWDFTLPAAALIMMLLNVCIIALKHAL